LGSFPWKPHLPEKPYLRMLRGEKMRRKKILSPLVMLLLILIALPAADAGTGTIKLSDY
jgi:hypothetical protein